MEFIKTVDGDREGYEVAKQDISSWRKEPLYTQEFISSAIEDFGNNPFLKRAKELKMKPGRELDALIAEKVMGYECECGGGDSLDCRLHGPTPNVGIPYSTDIASAMEIVEKLKVIPDIDDENNKLPIRIEFRDKKWRVSWGSVYWTYEHEANAEILPHAICLAALKTVGIE